MHIHIFAIGRWRDGPEQQLFNEYSKRLRGNLKLKEFEVRGAVTKDKEAQRMLDALPKNASLVVLDERGKDLDSQQFSQFINRLMEDGRDICFAIGGADGHGKLLLDAAEHKIRLGKMTWPHMLVRPMLAEQIYRARTILSGHPYHRA